MTPSDLNAFLADMHRADAIRALTKARTEAEVATIDHRLDLLQLLEDAGDEDECRHGDGHEG
jgi:hypothetical protein